MRGEPELKGTFVESHPRPSRRAGDESQLATFYVVLRDEFCEAKNKSDRLEVRRSVRAGLFGDGRHRSFACFAFGGKKQ